MSHFISIDKAKAMTALYREQKDTLLQPAYQDSNVWALSESFERSAVDRLLAQPGCEGLRIYYGLDDAMRVHAILVGYDRNNADILPAAASSSALATETEDEFSGVLEEGNRCPDMCPPDSPLNGDQP
jgi:hypothetical protein